MLAGLELHHHSGELVLRHLTVTDRDACLGHELVHALGRLLDRAHAVVDEIDLAASMQLAADRLMDQLVVVGGDVRLDRLALFRWRLDHAHVADPAHGHVQRARNRRGRQRKHGELRAQLLEPLLLHHAEAVLLVDHEQAEALEPDVALEQAVRADHDVNVTCLQSLDRARLRLVIDESREHLHHDREVLQALAKNVEVLLREHGGGCQQRDLLATHGRLERGAQRELGLAKPDVPAQQSVHRPVRLHVRLDLGERGDLVRRLFIRKGRLELLLPCGVRREGDAGPRLAHGVDLQQVLGQSEVPRR